MKASPDLFADWRALVGAALDALAAEGALPAGLPRDRIAVEPPRDPSHGHLSTNAAMALAKPAGVKPRDLAEQIVAKLAALPGVAAASVAGPGFVNLSLDAESWRAHLRAILAWGEAYGDRALGGGEAVNVEYVSANPTGPLHAAHARGAVLGDALANLLEKAGWAVTREYYINDAGGQVDVLARSAHLRYREALGEEIGDIPEGLYPGDYMIPVGRALAEREGGKWRAAPEADWLPLFRETAIAMMMDEIRADLRLLGVEHSVFSSERALVAAGGTQAALDTLAAEGLIYEGVLAPPKGKTPEDWEPRPQTLFRASDFGDDIDRPLKKSDSTWTYFANDIAYHHDKLRRGCPRMINVWGADHGGYVTRMKAAVKAITKGEGALDVLLCQLVRLMDDGQPVKMSKRAGTFITLRDVVDAVGRDAVRFMMLTRKADQVMDFDFAAVKAQTKDNPVFYVQYAHARCRSVMRHAAEAFPEADLSDAALSRADLAPIAGAAECALIAKLAEWPRLVETAALAREPHRVSGYLMEVASAFHAVWNSGRDDATLRFIHPGDEPTTRAKLALVAATRAIVASGLKVFGVEPVEEM